MAGPLIGVSVVEFAGRGPGPFASMLLADMGASVTTIERREGQRHASDGHDLLLRGRRSIAIDLRKAAGVAIALDLVERADVLVEGHRPGVMERLGLGPDQCLVRSPSLVYARITGWGQDGELAARAGHDLNYIALSGALSLLGDADRPPKPPLNLLGNYAGGGMMLAFGIAAALVEARESGVGQVIDAAMVDGTALLTTLQWGEHAVGRLGPRGTNVMDGAAWYMATYETADRKFVAFAAGERAFRAEMIRRLGLADEIQVPADPGPDHGTDPAERTRIAAIIATKTREEWCEVFRESDACFAPVLSLDEAREHPHLRNRNTFVEIDGVAQPAPAPRFSRTQPRVRWGPVPVGAHTEEILQELGRGANEIEELSRDGVVRLAQKTMPTPK